ncbi:hypothetical protein [Bradyrhizobium canariense]|uniref:hypothetical protein n=1 Tax=Bradyrhizobium canariense TaxID=255045 RepID=UPI0011BAA2E2|nr:hypothetical protein [Bradyrhizobium canariense]
MDPLSAVVGAIGAALSPREAECLEWASQGKSAMKGEPAKIVHTIYVFHGWPDQLKRLIAC